MSKDHKMNIRRGDMLAVLVVTLIGLVAGGPTEVRFYTVREPAEESNNTVSENIQNLILAGRQHRVDQMLGQSTLAAKFSGTFQCQTLHKLFKKYKREFNSDQSMADETWHSVTSTAYLKMMSSKGAARIPLGVRADITRDLIGCDWANNTKFKFTNGGDVNTQMVLMERRDTDEKGHLVPSRLAGPAKWYNLAPQSPHVRAAVASGAPGWTDAETAIQSWTSTEGGKVEMLVMPIYTDLIMTRRIKHLPEGKRRPSGFSFCYRLYDHTGALRAELADNVNND